MAHDPSQRATLAIGWRDRPFQSMRSASDILGLSTATLYKMAARGDLHLKRLANRTLVATSEVVRLVDTAEEWTPSSRTARATAVRLARQPMGA
jgi:hypothetical protein